MIVGLIGNKVRQAVPKAPAKKCSPPPLRPIPSRCGPKPTPRPMTPLVQSTILGLDKDQFRNVPNEVWNALASTFRSAALELLNAVEVFSRLGDSHNDLLGFLQETIPQWTYQAGRQVTEAFLVDKTGFLGSRLKCDQCNEQDLRFKGYAPHSFKTVLGTVHSSRARYSCDCCSNNRYPLDHQLGLNGEHKMLPGLQEIVARMSAKSSYPEALDTLQSLLPIRFCLRTQEKVTQTVAAAARAEQEREHQAAFSQPAKAQWPAIEAPRDEEEVSSVAAISADGGFCPMKDKEEPAREFKLGVLGWLHPKPRATPEEEPPEVKGKQYTGTFKGADFAMELTELEYHRMGLSEAKLIQVIGDGADWIWNRAPNFKMEGQEIVFTLDLYHARERVSDTANAFFGHSTAASRKWYKARDAELIGGKLPLFFRAFTLLAKEAKDPTQRDDDELAELILANRKYFHKRKPMLNYKEFLARGLLVGSGMVEGGIRFVAKDRLNKTGMQWGEPGAENVLHLRSLYASGRWDEFSAGQTKRRIESFRSLESKWLDKAA